MQTKKRLISLIRSGTRLGILAAILITLLISNVTPAAAAPKVVSVSVGTQSGTLTSGTAGSVTFPITVTKSNAGGGSNNVTANLSVTGLAGFLQCANAGSPGPCWIFSPASLNWPNGGSTGPQSSTLTIKTSAATSAGSPLFTVNATRAGTPGDNASNSGTLTIQAPVQVSQTITFGALTAKTFGDPDFNVSATASSGLPVSFAATGNCSVVGTLVHLTGAGSCTITASQAGNASYLPAPNVPLTFAIALGNQAITFGVLTSKTFGDADFNVSATASSGLTVSFAASGDCTVVGTLVSLTGAGSCTITASQPGDANYNAAADVPQTFAIDQATPTITFGAAPMVEYPGIDFTASATTNSDGTLTYSFVSGPCTLVDANAGTFTPTGLGTCVVQADTTATINFAAGSAQQSITITAPITHLYAVAGNTTLGTQSVTVWGYNSTNAAVTQPGGPTLIVNEGDTVMVALHNELSVGTALLFQGQDMIPDIVGVTAGGTKLYIFTANRPGTYLYGAGLLAGAQYQSAMGLYGALIVRPATAGQAYNDVTTAYNDEAVLVLSEVDPALNNNATPATFDMRNFAPRYFLINGQAYPNTTAIPTAAGNRVLLRYLNAGMQFHSMALLGTHQTVIANDGSPLAYSHRMVAETFGPGQTVDTIATIPAATVDGSKLAVYDGNLMLRNSNAAGFGGMLTFLTVSGTPPTGDTTGPVTSNVAYAAGTLTATVDDSATGGSTITAAEYFMDTVGAPNTGTAMSGAFASPTEVVTAAVIVPPGAHTLYVRGMDSSGNWGTVSSVLVNGGDAIGPATTGPTLTPNPSNGSVNVALHATGNDSASGGSNIAAAEYTIDGGTAVPMTVNIAAPIASLDATISAATVNALAEGTHVVAIRSQDAVGNWGALTTINLIVDKTGPTTSTVTAAPNPNNGQVGFNTTTPAVRVTASFADTIANINAGEGFIDTVGADGTGFPFAASDGSFNSQSETGFADIPLTTIILLSNGTHTIYVHSKDAAGNWGPTSSVILTIDKIAPAVSAVSAAPNPTVGDPVTLSATATDAATAVTQAEWFTGADPGVGNGTAMTVSGTGPWSLSAAINISTWVNGSYTLNVRARDAAGNWSALGSTVLVVNTPPPPFPGLYFSTFGNTAVPTVGGTADDADIYNWNGTAYSRVFDASVAGLPGNANVDGYDRVDATHFYLSFSAANTAVPGLGNVQDEDVVYYNNGTWSVYFDGTAQGMTAGGQDLDAISIVGGILYFSTTGNVNPPTLPTCPAVGGTADNADIYSWNGTCFARVWDATANGLPGAANVDGYVRVDATHFYLSFSNTTTTVPVLGAVADVNVVYNNAGTWSVFFDGTAHGLVAGTGQDIDAFDLP